MYSLIYGPEEIKSNKCYKWICFFGLGQRHYHRKNGPAVVYNDSTEVWYFKGRIHREENLPAVSYANGHKSFWIHGEEYILQENGTKEFLDIPGRLHRDRDLPAIEYPNGDQEWWVYGQRHRKDGPAVIIGNKQFWFEEGEFIKCSI